MSYPVVYVTLNDPEPPIGTGLATGNPLTSDRATFMRLASGWTFAYGGDRFRPCTYELVRYWLTARVVAGPLLQEPSRRPAQVSVPDDLDWEDVA